MFRGYISNGTYARARSPQTTGEMHAENNASSRSRTCPLKHTHRRRGVRTRPPDIGAHGGDLTRDASQREAHTSSRRKRPEASADQARRGRQSAAARAKTRHLDLRHLRRRMEAVGTWPGHDHTAARRGRAAGSASGGAARATRVRRCAPSCPAKIAIGSRLRGRLGAGEAREAGAAPHGAAGRPGCHAGTTCERWEARAEGQQGIAGRLAGQGWARVCALVRTSDRRWMPLK